VSIREEDLWLEQRSKGAVVQGQRERRKKRDPVSPGPASGKPEMTIEIKMLSHASALVSRREPVSHYLATV
jgi:hypothetical protein